MLKRQLAKKKKQGPKMGKVKDLVKNAMHEQFAALTSKPVATRKPNWREKSYGKSTTQRLPVNLRDKLLSFEHSVSANNLSFERLVIPGQDPVPPLANNLDRVLFNPGVHFLKDARTNVYNFTPELENIMSIRDFDFTKIPAFVPSGKDNRLAELARDNGKKYTGSTSSMTGVLTQLHHALSNQRPPQIMGLSKYFPGRTTTFTAAQLAPTLVNLRYNSTTGTYALQSVASDDDIILSLLGHTMETMLVTESKVFQNYHRKLSHLLDQEEPSSTYNYMQSGPFLIRSQLDCYDHRLPGSGFFDLKTRAACAVRHDIDYAQIHDGSYYQINKRDGFEESYAREYYELIRSALFKYSLQARIGSMDGIFVAYHNIKTLFGFEYLPLPEIDAVFHTSHIVNAKDPELYQKRHQIGPIIADREFSLSLEVLSQILQQVISNGPSANHSFNLAVQCVGKGKLVVLVKPMLDKHLADPIKEVPEEYVENEDPATLKQLYRAKPDFMPPDVYGFQVDIASTINGRRIPANEHPSLENKDDEWSIEYNIKKIADPNWCYGKTLSKLIDQEITSTPITERSHDEEALRELALAKLPSPNKFQRRLRELQLKGQVYKEWDDTREKLVWEPNYVHRKL